VQQIEITPDKFGGNFYLEASTLFRDTNGVDMPAEFIIPNCKVQSNFTFSMASSGDPSTFTFTMDAFPDYTRFNKTKKVLSAIQVLTEESEDEYKRVKTDADLSYDVDDKVKAEEKLNDKLIAAIDAINNIPAGSHKNSIEVTSARAAVTALTNPADIALVYNLNRLAMFESIPQPEEND
jgi:hypothetical protein